MSRVLFGVAAAIAVLTSGIPAPALADSDVQIVTPENANWEPISPKQTVGGPVIHVLWGDPLKREGGFLLKLPGDSELPERMQSSSYTVVVVSGAWMHGASGDDLVEVRPGAYYKQRANQRHRDKCVAGPDCVVVVRTSGKFDLKPVLQDVTGEVKSQVPARKARRRP